MEKWEATFDKFFEHFFHLPTLVIFAVIGMLLIWFTYDIGLDVGAGFARLTSNQGGLNLYWGSGCCTLSIQ